MTEIKTIAELAKASVDKTNGVLPPVVRVVPKLHVRKDFMRKLVAKFELGMLAVGPEGGWSLPFLEIVEKNRTLTKRTFYNSIQELKKNGVGRARAAHWFKMKYEMTANWWILFTVILDNLCAKNGVARDKFLADIEE